MITVLLADDHAAVRAGLALICDGADDITVVGQASDGEEAVESATRLRPDVVVMDIRMPRMDGVTATRELVGICDVLVLTTYGDERHVFAALAAGAAGFLLKDAEADELLTGIRLVARGDGMIAPTVTRALIDQFGRQYRQPAPHPEVAMLTARERQVFELIGQGQSNARIGTSLGMAEATVKTHVSRILTKLKRSSRVQAAILYRELHGE